MEATAPTNSVYQTTQSAFRTTFQWIRRVNTVYYVETALFALYTQSVSWTTGGMAVGFSIGLLEGAWEGKNTLRRECVTDAVRVSTGNSQANCRTYQYVSGAFLLVNNTIRYIAAHNLPSYVPSILGCYDGLRTARMAGQEIGSRWALFQFSQNEQMFITPKEQQVAGDWLDQAIKNQDIETVEVLFTSPIRVSQHHFCSAILTGNLELIQLFFDHDKVGDINDHVQDPIYDSEKYLYTPLQYAGTAAVVKLLLDRGADPFKKCGVNGLSRTTLHSIAARPPSEQNVEILKLLLAAIKWPLDIDKKDDEESTALLLAIKQGATPYVKLLLDRKAEIGQAEQEAAEQANQEIKDLLWTDYENTKNNLHADD